jgi:arylsulfatase A-like enzyme
MDCTLAKNADMVRDNARANRPTGLTRVADTDIHIPFFVRGPGVDEGSVLDAVTTHTDVSSTLLKIAGVGQTDLDGVAMPLGASLDSERHEHATIEYWGAVSDPNVLARRFTKFKYYTGRSGGSLWHAKRW